MSVAIIVFKIFAFIFGITIGSFANVVIYRLPRNMDLVWQRSHCIKCKKMIPWYFNIPLLSWLLLRGKCLYCKTKISIRYFLVEFMCGLASLLLFPAFLTQTSLLHYLFMFTIFVCFIIHVYIDLEFKILPDSINLILFILFLINLIYYQDWKFAGIGFSIGLLFPLSITYLFYKLKGKIGLGGGDIKLYALLGLYLGPLGVIHNIFGSCFLGSIIGIILILFKKMDKDNPIPFGPFIIAMASFQIFFPVQYQSAFGQLFKYIL